MRTIARPESPAVTTGPIPIRSTALPDEPAPMISPSASGVITAPASMAEYPWANCRYWVSAKMPPSREKNATLTASVPTLNCGIAEELRAGAWAAPHGAPTRRRWRAGPRRPSAGRGSGRCPSPAPAPRSPRRPARRSRRSRGRRPATSNAPGFGSRLSGTSRSPSSTAISAIGTLTRKTADQSNHSISSPPTSGPSPIPTAARAAQIPIALPRSSAGRRWR